MNYLHVGLICLIAAGCGPSGSVEKVAKEPAPATPGATAVIPVSEPERSDDENYGSVDAVDPLVFPGEATGHIIRIIAEGTYHDDEVWSDAGTLRWWGLFKTDAGACHLRRTRFTTRNVYDPILDEEGATTGIEVSSGSADTSIVLIGNADAWLDEHPVATTSLPGKILPGDTVRFTFLDRPYTLYATGEKRKVSDSWFEISNYKLFLAVEKGGVAITQLLVAQPNFEDHMTGLLFAGDIDGDSVLDLILDTSYHYNAFIPTLYLSKPAGKQEIVKVVARHTAVGC